MKLLVGALLPTAGSIQVDGRPLTRSEKQLKSRLGYLPQDFGLFDELTVAQFLDYMAALKEIRSPKTSVSQAIEAVNLKEKAKSKIRTLSGGQRQRVALPRRCLRIPPFLFSMSLPWGLTRRNGFISATCFLKPPKTVWCCSPHISLRTCSLYATSWW